METRRILENVFALSLLFLLTMPAQAFPKAAFSNSENISYSYSSNESGQIFEIYSELTTKSLNFGAALVQSVAMRFELGYGALLANSRSAYAAHVTHSIGPSLYNPMGRLQSNAGETRASKKSTPLFGATRIKFGQIAGTARIASLMKASGGDKSSMFCDDSCVRLAHDLGQMTSGTESKLGVVTRAVNHIISYEKDDVHQFNRDYWSTASETLQRRKGDCEDYAILKMAILSRIGIPLTSMEIVVVKDKRRQLFHAVLSVSLNDKHFILDNLTNKIEVDVNLSNYQPIYSVSQRATYVFGKNVGTPNNVASAAEITTLASKNGF